MPSAFFAKFPGCAGGFRQAEKRPRGKNIRGGVSLSIDFKHGATEDRRIGSCGSPLPLRSVPCLCAAGARHPSLLTLFEAVSQPSAGLWVSAAASVGALFVRHWRTAPPAPHQVSPAGSVGAICMPPACRTLLKKVDENFNVCFLQLFRQAHEQPPPARFSFLNAPFFILTAPDCAEGTARLAIPQPVTRPGRRCAPSRRWPAPGRCRPWRWRRFPAHRPGRPPPGLFWRSALPEAPWCPTGSRPG